MIALIGVLLAIWGILVVCSALFRKEGADYRDDGQIGERGFGVFEDLLKVFFDKIPAKVAKVVLVLFGFSFIITGVVMIRMQF